MTGCERILARLEQGPATAAELYATTYTVVHSRIADLRKRGYVIECEHVGGEGAQAYLYRLLSGGHLTPSGLLSAEQVVPGGAKPPLPPPALPVEQLSLEAA